MASFEKHEMTFFSQQQATLCTFCSSENGLIMMVSARLLILHLSQHPAVLVFDQDYHHCIISTVESFVLRKIVDKV